MSPIFLCLFSKANAKIQIKNDIRKCICHFLTIKCNISSILSLFLALCMFFSSENENLSIVEDSLMSVLIVYFIEVSCFLRISRCSKRLVCYSSVKVVFRCSIDQISLSLPHLRKMFALHLQMSFFFCNFVPVIGIVCCKPYYNAQKNSLRKLPMYGNKRCR